MKILCTFYSVLSTFLIAEGAKDLNYFAPSAKPLRALKKKSSLCGFVPLFKGGCLQAGGFVIVLYDKKRLKSILINPRHSLSISLNPPFQRGTSSQKRFTIYRCTIYDLNQWPEASKHLQFTDVQFTI